MVGRIQCASCLRYFMSITGFDQHRTGSFAKEERRCRSDEELREMGMDIERRDVHMLREGKDYKETHDVWYDVVGRETMRKVFAKEALE